MAPPQVYCIKLTTMMDSRLFEKLVLQQCKEELQPLVKRLRGLFIDDNCYHQQIASDDFLRVCKEELAEQLKAS